MKDGSYILIKEASKKYGKTRQTFYNYMRKGLIQTKKVSNKVYMSVKDIERIFGNYLAPEPEKMVQEKQATTSQSIIDATYTHEIRVDALEKQVDNLQKALQSQKEQNITPPIHQSTLENTVTGLQAHLHNIQDYSQNIAKSIRLEKKKRIFVWGVAAFVLANTVILTIASSIANLV